LFLGVFSGFLSFFIVVYFYGKSPETDPEFYGRFPGKGTEFRGKTFLVFVRL